MYHFLSFFYCGQVQHKDLVWKEGGVLLLEEGIHLWCMGIVHS
jgi:hypothetical protein